MPIPIVYQMPDSNQDAIDKINQECYDNCASNWDRFPFPEKIPQFVKKYYKPELGNKVLDIGSGTGQLARWLADQGFDVLCLDPSTEMVKRCQAKGLRAEQISIQSYKPQNQFAMIFAILSLIHVPKADFDEQIKKIASALPKDGILFLAMLEGKGEGVFEKQQAYPRYFSYFTQQEIDDKIQPYFVQKDYAYFYSGNIGYMLFVLIKK
jgi:2-polyprenyl-3-methyl-5-hydroxy-6-metoxy-1,4-benzoquinol methylase